MAHAVSRKRILESPDCNFSGDRYKDNGIRVSTKWPMVKLGDVCELIGGGTPSKADPGFWTNGTIKWISAKHINEDHKVIGYERITEQAVRESSTVMIPAGAVVFVTRVSVGKLTLLNESFAINQDLTGIVTRDPDRLIPSFCFAVLKHLAPVIVSAAQGLGVKGVTREYMATLVIPLPPLDVQRQIVAELDGYRKIIEGAKQVIANYEKKIQDKLAEIWGEGES